MKKPSAWMPLYIGDYLADTMHLNATESGAYLFLIMHYWRCGPPPDDDRVLATLTRVERSLWELDVGPVVRRFFIAQDGVLRHKRIDSELETAGANVRQRSLAGKRSVEARKLKKSGSETHTEVQRKVNGVGNENLTDVPTDVPTKVPTKAEREAQRKVRPSPSPIKKEDTLRVSKKSDRLTEIDPNWRPAEDGVAYAKERGVRQSEVKNFVDHHLAHGKVMADWNAAWRTWCRNAVKFGNATPLLDAANYIPSGVSGGLS